MNKKISGLPNMVKLQFFDDILDHKIFCLIQIKDIYILCSKSCCENASSIGSKFGCSFWQSIWTVLVTQHNPDGI